MQSSEVVERHSPCLKAHMRRGFHYEEFGECSYVSCATDMSIWLLPTTCTMAQYRCAKSAPNPRHPSCPWSWYQEGQESKKPLDLLVKSQAFCRLVLNRYITHGSLRAGLSGPKAF